MTSIVDASQYLFTSESVTEGHPDKLCDQVSDAILDAIIRDDPEARVACETATTTGLVIVLGEITTKADLRRLPAGRPRDRPRHRLHARPTTASTTRPAARSISIKEQSPDIAQGVDAALEVRGEAVDVDELGRRRPGNDVRLRLPRDAGADAAADRARPPDGAAPRRGPQVRPAAVPPPRRQDAGDRRVRARRPEAASGPSSSRPSTIRMSGWSGSARTSPRP